MLSRIRSLAALVALPLALLGVRAGSAGPPPQYEAIPISGPGFFAAAHPLDLNNHGQVVGFGTATIPPSYPVRGFIWEDGLTTDIGDIGFPYVEARAINDTGQIAGIAEVGGDAFHAFLWEGGKMRDLGTLNGATSSYAVDINGLGEVLGFSAGHVVIWSGGSIEDVGLLSLPGGSAMLPTAFNDARQIIGEAQAADGNSHALFYDDGVLTDIGLLPGDDFGSRAFGINKFGQVAGQSSRLGGPNGTSSRGFIWRGGTFTDIMDPISGLTQVFANDVNSAGQVVGMLGWPQAAFLFDRGVLHDLNDLLVPGGPFVALFEGTAINDDGWIVIDDFIGTGAYVLRPVQPCPEDVNGDNLINVLDLIDLLLCFGQTAVPGCEPQDLNGDGAVNVLDLIDLLLVFGQACP